MLADGVGHVEPSNLEVLAMGRTLEELSSGLIVLHLPEWRWIRRGLSWSQPPPPVLVWLPGTGPLPPDMACLGQLRDWSRRFP
jgi:hypothetical protein